MSSSLIPTTSTSSSSRAGRWYWYVREACLDPGLRPMYTPAMLCVLLTASLFLRGGEGVGGGDMSLR